MYDMADTHTADWKDYHTIMQGHMTQLESYEREKQEHLTQAKLIEERQKQTKVLMQEHFDKYRPKLSGTKVSTGGEDIGRAAHTAETETPTGNETLSSIEVGGDAHSQAPNKAESKDGSGKKPIQFSPIHPDFPTIVQLPNSTQYVELRCKEVGCNGNARLSVDGTKSFLQGGIGFLRHYQNVHPNVMPRGTTVTTAVKHCTHKIFTQAEIEDMLANRAGAYKVETLRLATRQKPIAETVQAETVQAGNLQAEDLQAGEDEEEEEILGSTEVMQLRKVRKRRRFTSEAYLDDMEFN